MCGAICSILLVIVVIIVAAANYKTVGLLEGVPIIR
jgi:hypothetical protein